MKSRPIRAIVVGGLAVGILDLVYAILVYSPRRPIRVPQAIATGLLGRSSFERGMPAAFLGILCHFSIAFGAATVYYLASRKLPILTRRAVLSGMVYGGLVYFFMHLVVIPLSAVPAGHTPVSYKVLEFVEHWFFVGLPIALSVRKY